MRFICDALEEILNEPTFQYCHIVAMNICQHVTNSPPSKSGGCAVMQRWCIPCHWQWPDNEYVMQKLNNVQMSFFCSENKWKIIWLFCQNQSRLHYTSKRRGFDQSIFNIYLCQRRWISFVFYISLGANWKVMSVKWWMLRVCVCAWVCVCVRGCVFGMV